MSTYGTKRIIEDIASTSTRRVSGVVTENSTKRVSGVTAVDVVSGRDALGLEAENYVLQLENGSQNVMELEFT